MFKEPAYFTPRLPYMIEKSLIAGEQFFDLKGFTVTLKDGWICLDGVKSTVREKANAMLNAYAMLAVATNYRSKLNDTPKKRGRPKGSKNKATKATSKKGTRKNGK